MEWYGIWTGNGSWPPSELAKCDTYRNRLTFWFLGIVWRWCLLVLCMYSFTKPNFVRSMNVFNLWANILIWKPEKIFCYNHKNVQVTIRRHNFTQSTFVITVLSHGSWTKCTLMLHVDMAPKWKPTVSLLCQPCHAVGIFVWKPPTWTKHVLNKTYQGH